jgi:hypothetical protein
MLLDSSSFISWVKSHSGLQGNELADKLVKQGSQLKGPCPYSNQYFQLFQETIIKSFQNFPTKIGPITGKAGLTVGKLNFDSLT